MKDEQPTLNAKQEAYRKKQIAKINRNTCDKKRRYSDIPSAMAMAMGRDEKLYYYRCKLCAGYHLTKNGAIRGNEYCGD